MSPSAPFWSGKRVLLTGHTGFKGGWLSLWLAELGAQVHGLSLAPPTTPNLFTEAGIERRLAGHRIGDIRDPATVADAVAAARPEIVIHMAAQPLVRASYAHPVETFATNVMGTAHVLDAVRRHGGAAALVSVTTDKCYQNREWAWGYRENEALGGHDPYSASKAGAELVTAAWRSSFGQEGGPWIASARAGNVIGGGDWAADRLIPDALRALDAGETLAVRSPGATRPWQHVLEPLSGYLLLAERLAGEGRGVAEAFNFGPVDDDARPVGWILDRLQALEPALAWAATGEAGVHEAGFLKLDSSKARARLGWAPRWRLGRALAETLDWHRAWRGGADMAAFTAAQIGRFVETAADD